MVYLRFPAGTGDLDNDGNQDLGWLTTTSGEVSTSPMSARSETNQ
ncbi:hypothetical protein [Rugosimonospora acidiphila]